jgi:hypothetical protein
MVKAVPTPVAAGHRNDEVPLPTPWHPGGQSDSAAADVAGRGLDLLGPPVVEDEEAELTEVAAYALQRRL